MLKYFSIAMVCIVLVAATQARAQTAENADSAPLYEPDSVSRDTVLDIQDLLDSLRNENALSPETQRILSKIPANSLPSTERSLEVKHNVDIERGNVEPVSIFDAFEDEKENVNISGDRGFDMKVKQPALNDQKLLKEAYQAMASGQMEGAAALYKKIIYEDPENTQALFGLASAYYQSGQKAQAKSTYARLLTLDRENWPALNNFLVLAAEESPEHALEEFKRLMQINPEFAPIPAQIGMIYLKQNNYQDAALYLRKAVMLAPDHINYRYNLAVTYDKIGMTKQAARLYQQIIEAANKGSELPGDVGAIQERLTYLMSSTAATSQN